MNRITQKALALLAAAVFLFSAAAQTGLADPATTQRTPVALDLTSKVANLTAGNPIKTGAVSIMVGGQAMSVTSTTPLTPAERLAVYQMVSTGVQSIQLGLKGNAVGGTFNIGSNFSHYVSSLVIPNGVTAPDNFAKSQKLNLTGNLTNNGNMLLFSTSPAVISGQVSANNIINNQNAVLSSVLNSATIAAAGLNASQLVNNVGFTLSALNNIVNHGTISSAGFLSANAGNALTNTGVMSATKRLNDDSLAHLLPHTDMPTIKATLRKLKTRV